MSNPLAELLAQEKVDAGEIARLLDAMAHAERVTATRSLSGALMGRLYEAASRPASAESFVPAAVPPLTPVRHYGTNSLPFFRKFEKQMYRDEAGGLFGRNVQAMQALTGPGYFTLVSEPGAEPAFDYQRLPATAPPGWPKIRSNARGLSYFVFRGLMDFMRACSEHVTVGRVTRFGKEQNQHFVLVREA